MVKFVLSCYEFVIVLGRSVADLHFLFIHEECFRNEIQLLLVLVAVYDLADDMAPIIKYMQVPAFRHRLADFAQLPQLLKCNFFVVCDVRRRE